MLEIEKYKARLQQEIYESNYFDNSRRTDLMFSKLFIFQWLLGIVFALWISPKTWIGDQSFVHIHVYAAIFLGGLVAAFPIILILKKPGDYLNRYVVATSQILFSILYIHLTGGRIETHFHVFGSLAFLAFYKDIRPVILATLITAADHLLRGYFWPQSVYGAGTASIWRALEHAAWVLFEDSCLYISIKNSLEMLTNLSKNQADARGTLSHLEQLVEIRADEIKKQQQTITEQQQAMATSSKMSALGEMAGGIAHEINSPLAIISMRTEQLEDCVNEGDCSKEDVISTLEVIKKTTNRIAKIVKGLKFFARDGRTEPFAKIPVTALIEDTLSFCRERFSNHGVQFEVKVSNPNVHIACSEVELSQVLLNLLNNAFDAVSSLKEKWVHIDVIEKDEYVELNVTDSGKGIPLEVQSKIMQPFFTTKEVGKGTGLGLSLSKGIVEKHGGRLYLDTNCPNTRFVIRLPRVVEESKQEQVSHKKVANG